METPKDLKEIIHMDVYTNTKANFLTFLDKFSKFATVLYLEDRNNQTIIEKIREFKSQRGHFKKLVTDNEFKSINIKDYLRNEEIELHLVKPNNHTGNADIERLHSTIGELNIKEKMFKAVEWYNNSIHSTTKEKPINIQEGKCEIKKIYENFVKEKTRYISKLNIKREDYKEGRSEGYIKNYKSVRHKEEPKFVKKDLKDIHSSNIKRKYKFLGELDIKNISNPDNIDDNPDTVNSK